LDTSGCDDFEFRVLEVFLGQALKLEWKFPGTIFKILTGKPTETIYLKRSRRRWEDKVRINNK